MGLAYFVVDAFVNESKQFSGNPAAVFLLKSDDDLSDQDKQSIAAELNLAQSAFVSALPDGGGETGDRFLIRWFSPAKEVKLCGHATLASAFVLFTQSNLYSDQVQLDQPLKFRTRFGAQLQASIDVEDRFVTRNFPAQVPVPATFDWLEAVKSAIARGPENAAKWFVGGAQFSPNKFLVLRLRDDLDIAQLSPNYDQLLNLYAGDLVAIVVTKKADYKTSGKHFESRVFGPWVGINEDPVTGSSFTALTPYWDKVYREEFGEQVDAFVSVQASARTGLVRNELTDGGSRVLIGGQARIFSKGEFLLELEDDLDKLHI